MKNVVICFLIIVIYWLWDKFFIENDEMKVIDGNYDNFGKDEMNFGG